jgi:hypothetical protein
MPALGRVVTKGFSHMTQDDEPVGYLGGAAADDDPYAAPAEDDPYGAPAEDDPYGAADGFADEAGGEPEFALPGAEGEPEFALPGAEGVDEEYALPGAAGEPEHALPPADDGGEADYSASDFMADGAPVDDDPYATETYDDPYATQDGYEDEYGSYEDAEADDGYYDSMGHDDDLETGMATETEVGYDTEEFADDDQPKTISQQDAESIIRRITTKRILPPEQQQAQPMARPQPLTPGGGGLKMWPILIVLLLLGGGGAFVFREQLFGTGDKPVVGIQTPKPTISAQERAKRLLVKRILTSEAKAFDRKPEELLNQENKKTTAPSATPEEAKTEEKSK